MTILTFLFFLTLGAWCSDLPLDFPQDFTHSYDECGEARKVFYGKVFEPKGAAPVFCSIEYGEQGDVIFLQQSCREVGVCIPHITPESAGTVFCIGGGCNTTEAINYGSVHLDFSTFNMRSLTINHPETLVLAQVVYLDTKGSHYEVYQNFCRVLLTQDCLSIERPVCEYNYGEAYLAEVCVNYCDLTKVSVSWGLRSKKSQRLPAIFTFNTCPNGGH